VPELDMPEVDTDSIFLQVAAEETLGITKRREIPRA